MEKSTIITLLTLSTGAIIATLTLGETRYYPYIMLGFAALIAYPLLLDASCAMLKGVSTYDTSAVDDEEEYAPKKRKKNHLFYDDGAVKENSKKNYDDKNTLKGKDFFDPENQF